MNRTPPVDVRRQLRREVSGRCPICASPFLVYHHFDPTWRVLEHQNPEGMIALCTKCHYFADQGKYTAEQLRELKQNPNPSLAKFGWQRNELIFIAAGFHINPRVILRLHGRDVVWHDRDEHNDLLLNVDVRDERNRSVILIENNDLIEFDAVDGIDDTEIAPGGQRLSLRASGLGIRFSIKYRNYDQEALERLGQKMRMPLKQRIGPKRPMHPKIERLFTPWNVLVDSIRIWPVTVCSMRLSLRHPFLLDIRHGQAVMGRTRLERLVSVHTGVVLNISDSA